MILYKLIFSFCVYFHFDFCKNIYGISHRSIFHRNISYISIYIGKNAVEVSGCHLWIWLILNGWNWIQLFISTVVVVFRRFNSLLKNFNIIFFFTKVELKALLGLCYFRGINQHNLLKAEVIFSHASL